MTRRTPTKPGLECFCGDTSGKCRITTGHSSGTDGFLCMTFGDYRFGQKIEGHFCAKSGSNGYATFIPDNSHEWTEQTKAERDRRRAERQQRTKQEQERLKRFKVSSVNRDERHRLYSQAFDSLSVNEETSSDLRRRSFSDEEISRSGFKSIEKYQKLPFKVDENLPGIGQGGKYLIINGAGYLCPIKDYEGRILASQVRLYVPDGKNRYKNLSSDRQCLKLQPEDENPIGVYHPPEKPTGVAIVEGTGAKPFLVASRLGLITICAPGGQFPSSPKILKEYLDKAYLDVGEKSLVIFPDAGDVINPQVTNRWRSTARLAVNLGWRVQFGWWGQVTKNDFDVDELDNYSDINHISQSEFFQLAEKHKSGAGFSTPITQHPLPITQHPLPITQHPTPNTPSEPTKKRDKIIAKQADFEQCKAIRHKLTHITETPYKVVNVPHMGEVLKSLIEPGTVNIIISDTGTGKTESITPLAQSSESVYSWHNRISLAKAMCTILGLTYKDDISNSRYSNKKKAGFCAPSACQFDPKHLLKQGIVLLDEVDQVLDFLFGSLCNDKGIRPLLLSMLEAHIATAIEGRGLVLCMSADVTQKEIDHIKSLVPEGTPVRLIINEYQPERPSINFDVSPSPEGLLDKLVSKLSNSVPCFALDDMKNGVKGCKSVAEYIRETMPEIADLVLEIHSDSTSDLKVKAFFDNPDEESKKYQLIICSPSVISGLSLKNQRFINGVFGFCNGILMDRQIKQFLNRVRGAKDIYLWVVEEAFAPKGIDSDLLELDEIGEYYKRNYEANAKHILTFKPDYKPMRDEWTSPHFELFKKNLSYKIATARYLREFTREHLQSIGYSINEVELLPVEGIDPIKNKLTNCWNGIEVKEAEAIDSGRILSDVEMEALENSREEIPADIMPSYQKTRMLKKFGQKLIDATEFEHKKTKQKFTGFAAMALKNARGEYERQLDNFYLLNQELGESIARDYAAEARQLKHSGDRFAGDIRWSARRRKCREWIGLYEFLDPDKWFEPSDYQELVNKVKSRASTIKDVLGFNVEEMTGGQIFGQLMQQIGLSFTKKNIEGKKWKARRISADSWQYAQMYLEYRRSLKLDSEELPQAEQMPVPEIDPIVPLLAEELIKATTKAGCEDLFDTVTEEQKQQAWQLLPNHQQQRIHALYQQPEFVQLSITESAAESKTHEAVVSGQQPGLEKAIATQSTVPTWKGLKLQIKKGLKLAEEIFVNAYQRCVNEFTCAGIAKSEPYYGSVEGLRSVDVYFGQKIGVWGVPCDWLESV